jgi:adenylate kinase
MASGGLVSVSTVVSMLKTAIQKRLAEDKPPGFLIDGFPRELSQVSEFKKQFGRDCTVLLYLNASEETMTKRLLSRGLTSGRSDDNAEAIKSRLQTLEGRREKN